MVQHNVTTEPDTKDILNMSTDGDAVDVMGVPFNWVEPGRIPGGPAAV